MLIPPLLWQWNMIERAYFYVSGFLEAHRNDYYESLLSVSRDREWTTWTLFFMKAVRTQAEENLAKARGILGLYDELKASIPRLRRSRYATPALDWLFRRPVFSSTDFVRGGDIPGPTARRLLTVLRTNGVLRELVPCRPDAELRCGCFPISSIWPRDGRCSELRLSVLGRVELPDLPTAPGRWTTAPGRSPLPLTREQLRRLSPAFKS